MITTIAVHQVRAFHRQRVLAVLLGALVAATALAGALGWSSQHTIVRVFDQATRLLAANGQPAPPNPFLLKPALSLLSNMEVYIPLIGALFAVVLGHLSVAEEESGGLGRLLFSRSMTRTQYALGKVTSLAVVLLGALAVSMVVSCVSLVVVNGSVSPNDLGRLSLFYAVSWLYLLTFALIGMITVLVTRTRPLALLSGIGVWLVITFAVPQFTSGLRPTQSLNPITEPVGLSQALFRLTSHAQSLSVAEQYKAAAGVILDTAAPESLTRTALHVLPILGLVLVLLVVTVRLVQVHDFSRSASNE